MRINWNGFIIHNRLCTEKKSFVNSCKGDVKQISLNLILIRHKTWWNVHCIHNTRFRHWYYAIKHKKIKRRAIRIFLKNTNTSIKIHLRHFRMKYRIRQFDNPSFTIHTFVFAVLFKVYFIDNISCHTGWQKESLDLRTFLTYIAMHSFAKPRRRPPVALFFCSCDTVYHKQEVRFLFH